MKRLHERLKKAQDLVNSQAQAVQLGTERAAARGLLHEVEQRVKDAEQSVQKAKTVAEPFLTDVDEVGEGESSESVAHSLSQLRDTMYAGGKALGSAKTFLAVKKIAAKRFAEEVATSSLEELGALQHRLDEAAKILGDVQKGTSGRKFIKLKQEVLKKNQMVEEKIKVFKEAVDNLQNHVEKDLEPAEMKEIFEKAGASQVEAQTSIDAQRPILVDQLRAS